MTKPNTFSYAGASHPLSPPITRQSIIKKVAKCAFLLLIFPVTLILLAFRLKPTIERWVEGIPNNPAVDRVPIPISGEPKREESEPTTTHEDPVEEEGNLLPGFEGQNAARTPDQYWQLIKEFFEKEEGLDHIKDMPASQLDVLKKDPGFLPAIVTLIEGNFNCVEKKEIIKTALDAYCIADKLGNPENILSKLTDYLTIYVNKTYTDYYNTFLKNCIGRVLDHGLGQHASAPCVEDFFQNCSDTELAQWCMDEHLSTLDSDAEESFLKRLSIVRLRKFFDENIDIKVLLTNICNRVFMLGIGYERIRLENSIDTVECINLKSLFKLYNIRGTGQHFIKYKQAIQDFFAEEHARLQREQEERARLQREQEEHARLQREQEERARLQREQEEHARQSRQQASPTPEQRRESNWRFFESFCRDNEVHLPLSHDQVAKIKNNTDFLPAIIGWIEAKNRTPETTKTVVQTIIDVYKIGHALEQLTAAKLHESQMFLAILTKKIREFDQKDSLQECLQECLKALLEQRKWICRGAFWSDDFPKVYGNTKGVNLQKEQTAYIKTLSKEQKEQAAISRKLMQNISCSILFYYFNKNTVLGNQLVEVCKRLEFTDGTKLSVDGTIETLFFQLCKRFTPDYDAEFMLKHTNGFEAFLLEKRQNECVNKL